MLQLSQICKRYVKNGHAVNALQDVSLHVAPGDFLSIIGPSGSGKTTLMNIMGCLDTPTSGSYLLQGKPVHRLRGSRMAQVRGELIGFIFQSFNLIPAMTAAENVELPLLLRGVDRKTRRLRAADALAQVGLEDRSAHRPSELSGGQQQRVAIARVLASQPALVLADEPTGNLDPQSGREVMEIIRGLNRQGRTIVLITHDLQVAASASRIAHMVQGKLQEEK